MNTATLGTNYRNHFDALQHNNECVSVIMLTNPRLFKPANLKGVKYSLNLNLTPNRMYGLSYTSYTISYKMGNNFLAVMASSSFLRYFVTLECV